MIICMKMLDSSLWFLLPCHMKAQSGMTEEFSLSVEGVPPRRPLKLPFC